MSACSSHCSQVSSPGLARAMLSTCLLPGTGSWSSTPSRTWTPSSSGWFMLEQWSRSRLHYCTLWLLSTSENAFLFLMHLSQLSEDSGTTREVGIPSYLLLRERCSCHTGCSATTTTVLLRLCLDFEDFDIEEPSNEGMKLTKIRKHLVSRICPFLCKGNLC